MGWPSKLELLILRLLIGGGESYGLALVKASDGALKRGTVYVTLGRMEEKGLVLSRQEDVTPEHIGIPRRLYKVTGLGERAVQAVEHGEALMQGVLA
jgi:PadR family transcriptional regulator, regulatory protein PadR